MADRLRPSNYGNMMTQIVQMSRNIVAFPDWLRKCAAVCTHAQNVYSTLCRITLIRLYFTEQISMVSLNLFFRK